MTKTKQTFESALEQLEQIVRDIESGQMTLDSAIEKFEEGVKLSRFCSEKLDQAEKKIEVLSKQENGRVETIPFDDEN